MPEWQVLASALRVRSLHGAGRRKRRMTLSRQQYKWATRNNYFDVYGKFGTRDEIPFASTTWDGCR
jgi:hypothetical protein